MKKIYISKKIKNWTAKQGTIPSREFENEQG